MDAHQRFYRLASTDAVRSTLKERSIWGAAFTAGSEAFDFLLRLVSTLVLARLLIPEYFGLLGMVVAITGIAERFSSLGLSTATVQVREISHEQCSNLFWVNVTAGMVFALGTCGLAPLIASFYQDPRLGKITIAIACNFIFGGLKVQHEALLTRQMKQPQIAINRLISSFLSASLAVGMALGGSEYWALVWREISRTLFFVAGVWILCPWIPSMPRVGIGMGNLLRFGRDMTLTEILVGVIFRLDGILIGKIAGATVLGVYRQAHSLIMAPVEQLNSPIQAVSQPGLSMLRAEPERYRRYYQRILFVVSLTTVPLGVFTVLYAKDIVLTVLGPQWIGATIFLIIFGVAAAIRPAVGTSGLVLITYGLSGRFFIAAVVHSVTLVILMVIGIPWGAVGIAIAHVSATLVLTPWKLRYSFAGTPVTIHCFLTAFSRPLAAAILMALVLLLLRTLVPFGEGPISLVTGCFTAFAAYFLCLTALPGGRSELRSLVTEVISALRLRKSGVGDRIPAT